MKTALIPREANLMHRGKKMAPKGKDFMASVTIYSDFGAQKNNI